MRCLSEPASGPRASDTASVLGARPGALVLVGGHSRRVGKTRAVEQWLRTQTRTRWIAVKVSAHRHGASAGAAVIEEDVVPSAQTQTGRYLLAGAARAFLCRSRDAHLPEVAQFVARLRASGTHVIVESNRLVTHVEPDLVIFALAPHIDDWKPSSDRVVARAHRFVLLEGPATSARASPRPGAAGLGAALVILGVLMALVASTPAAAQTPTAPSAAPVVARWRPALTNVTRVEGWHFFEPPPTGGDPDATFVGNRLRLGVSGTWRRIDLAGAVQYVQFAGLPTRAVGPGFLGTGGLYFDHGGATDARGVFVPALNVRVRLPRGVTVAAGRFGYTSGAEAPSGRPKIETVKRARLDSRLVGDFEWSLYQRAFDGLRADVDRPRWHASAAWMVPTQGGFEDDAGASLGAVDVGALTLTFRPDVLAPATDVAVFGYTYADDRPVTGRPDNTGRTARAADVAIGTIGASAVGAARRGRGEADWLVWVAVQSGRWYEQSHRAWSAAVEGGYQWSICWQPWLRAGYLHASGDGDAGDDRHGTFFAMVPTVRRYSFTTAYAPMNLRDAFVELIVRPAPRLRGRVDVRTVGLASAADRWYGGSGATRRRGSFFGYAGRPSGGHRDLGTVVEGAVDVTLTARWSVNAFVGTMDGGRVVRTAFAGDRLRFSYFESVIQF